MSYESLSPAGLDQNRMPLIKAEPVPHFETQFHPRTFARYDLAFIDNFWSYAVYSRAFVTGKKESSQKGKKVRILHNFN